MDNSEAILAKIDSINTNLSTLCTQQEVMKTDLKHMCNKVDQHDRILRGSNGNPGCAAIQNECRQLTIANYDILHGVKDEPGLIDKVRNLTGIRANVSRSLWIIAGAVIGSVVSIYVHNWFT